MNRALWFEVMEALQVEADTETNQLVRIRIEHAREALGRYLQTVNYKVRYSKPYMPPETSDDTAGVELISIHDMPAYEDTGSDDETDY